MKRYTQAIAKPIHALAIALISLAVVFLVPRPRQ